MTAGTCKGGSSSHHAGQEAEGARKGLGTRYKLQRLLLMTPHPPARFHLMNFSESPKIVPLAKDQVFNT
jgi:hypothetical protein